MSVRRALVSPLLLAAITVLPLLSRADDRELPPGVGPIPDVQSGSKGGVLVFPEHISKYAAVLPDEVADLVARGTLVVEVARQPLAAQRGIEVAAPPSTPITLQPGGSLGGFSGIVSPPLFSLQSVASSEGNKVEQAYKILWNAAGSSWMRRGIFERGTLTLFPSDDSEGRVVEFSLSRVASSLLGPAAGTSAALFREKISLLSPSSLKGVSWLTFRFVGTDEDSVWASSALIRQTRRMTGSNRSDSLFPGAFAPDDLFVWSGKVEAVKPLRIERRVMLVPLATTHNSLSKREVGECVIAQLSRQTFELNRDSQRYKQHPAWMPTSVRFSPRSVWRIELASLDPFSRDVLQTLVIDEETSMPVYRMVWGAEGRLQKVILGALASLEMEGISFPWLIGELIVNSESGTHSVVSVSELSLCNGIVAGATADDLDPSSLVEPEPTKMPSPTTASLGRDDAEVFEDELLGQD